MLCDHGAWHLRQNSMVAHDGSFTPNTFSACSMVNPIVSMARFADRMRKAVSSTPDIISSCSRVSEIAPDCLR